MRVLAALRSYLTAPDLAEELADANDRLIRYAKMVQDYSNTLQRAMGTVRKQRDEIADLRQRLHLLEVECRMWRQMNDEGA